ncbi:uncharacterized protein VP01_5496g1 [Puccinia sorghi]|uniref:DUF8040 domain-containing protein n=1 Tax=Puccinia sorghi TaxID=27349 RepID=A0A0L6UJI6_9BASI|nr:uncharacterized protein VP01_5496g1 [Puccinia sorghi]
MVTQRTMLIKCALVLVGIFFLNHTEAYYSTRDLLQSNIVLVNGCSIQVQEQVLLFLDIVINNNAMSQMAIKFQGGLFKVQIYFHTVIEALVEI